MKIVPRIELEDEEINCLTTKESRVQYIEDFLEIWNPQTVEAIKAVKRKHGIPIKAEKDITHAVLAKDRYL